MLTSTGASAADSSRAGMRERGVVQLQVLVAMTFLCGVCAMVVDYGILWVARAQAQNAADAAAFAGATVLAFDAVSTFNFDPDPEEMSRQAGLAVAAQHRVWGKRVEGTAISIAVDSDATCTPAGIQPPSERVYTCVRANVYFDKEHGHSLPTFFARAIDVHSQDVRASAVATVAPANTTSCVWPIAIPDKWHAKEDQWPPPSPYRPALDTYRQPTSVAPGDGYSLNLFTLTGERDSSLKFKRTDLGAAIEANQFVPVRLKGRAGTLTFSQAMETCNGAPVRIDDTLEYDASGTIGLATGGASARVAQDPGASWDTGKHHIRNSCAASDPPCAAMSPRLVALPVFDPKVYETSRQTGTPTIQISNFVGLFIEPSVSEIVGRLTTFPGDVDPATRAVGYQSAFLRTPMLFR